MFGYFFVRELFDNFAVGNKISIKLSINKYRQLFQAHPLTVVIVEHIAQNGSHLLAIVFFDHF